MEATRHLGARPRSYVVLGGTGGIGSALCRALAEEGCRISLAGRTPSKVEALAAEIGAHGAVVDARDASAVEAYIEQAQDRIGRIDGIATCVGSMLLKPAHRTTPEEWQDVMAANLDPAFATVRAAARLLRDSGGSVVLLASAAARIGLRNHEAISAAKAGVIGLMRSAAASYAGRGIRFNAVAPGLTRTPLSESITGNRALAEASRAMHPLGVLGEPEDVASAILWLLDPAQRWVTGQVLGVDGGLATLKVR